MAYARFGNRWFLIVGFATRCMLLLKAAHEALRRSPSLLASFAWGAVYDLGAASFIALPLVVLLTLLPARALVRAGRVSRCRGGVRHPVCLVVRCRGRVDSNT